MNTSDLLAAVTWIAFLVAIVAAVWRVRRRRTHIGSGAAGTVYDMLHEEKRKAVEIVVEGRAEARDPEHADGNLPDLENPRFTPKQPTSER
jgi:hypothetical protein